MWDWFRSKDLRAQIGSAASGDVCCVSHGYDGGFADPYRMTIGHRVPTAAAVPQGCYRVVVPGQALTVFNAQGPQP